MHQREELSCRAMKIRLHPGRTSPSRVCSRTADHQQRCTASLKNAKEPVIALSLGTDRPRAFHLIRTGPRTPVGRQASDRWCSDRKTAGSFLCTFRLPLDWESAAAGAVRRQEKRTSPHTCTKISNGINSTAGMHPEHPTQSTTFGPYG